MSYTRKNSIKSTTIVEIFFDHEQPFCSHGLIVTIEQLPLFSFRIKDRCFASLLNAKRVLRDVTKNDDVFFAHFQLRLSLPLAAA